MYVTWLAAVLSGVESWLSPVSIGVSIFIVTTPASSQLAIARCGGNSNGIGLVETSSAIAVPGASSPASGARPTAQSSVNIFSCTCAQLAVSASIEMSNGVAPDNLTPKPFFRARAGKGDRIVENPLPLTLLVLLPFPRGKGPGVSFFGATSFPGNTFHRPVIRIPAII